MSGAMLRPTAVVLVGSVGAQLLAILCLPIMSRQYSPEAIGGLQLILSSVVVLLPLSNMRLDMALYSAKSSELVGGIILSSVLLSLFSAFVVSCCAWLFLPFLPLTIIDYVVWLLPLNLFAAGLFQLANSIMTRESSYGGLSGAKLTQSGFFHLSSVAFGFTSVSPSSLPLVLFDACGRLLGFVIALRSISIYFRLVGSQINGRLLFHTIRSHATFVIQVVPSSALSALVSVMPVFWIAIQYGESAAGQFGMAWRTVFVPFSLVILAFNQVVTAQVSASTRSLDGESRQIVLRVIRISMLLGSMPVIAVYLLSPIVLPIFLGVEWELAGKIGQPLSLFLLATLIRGPINMVLIVARRTKFQLIWEVSRFIALLAITFSCWIWSVELVAGLWMYSAVMVFSSLVFVCGAYKFSVQN